jgi:hypothetical protein
VIGMVRAGLSDGLIPAGRLRQIPPTEVVAMPFGELPIHLRVVLIEYINNPRSNLLQLV